MRSDGISQHVITSFDNFHRRQCLSRPSCWDRLSNSEMTFRLFLPFLDSFIPLQDSPATDIFALRARSAKQRLSNSFDTKGLRFLFKR